MAIVLVVLAGVVLGSGTLVLLTVQGAAALGRCVSRDEDQRAVVSG